MSAYFAIVYIVVWIYVLLNFKHDIHMLQQNSYRIRRYWHWLEMGHFMDASRLVDVALVFLLLSTLLSPMLSALFTAMICVVKSVLILKKKHKKPLVFTKRVWRIYSVAGLLALICGGFGILFFGYSGDHAGYYAGSSMALSILLLISIVSWAFAISSILLLSPVERHINNSYLKDARRILKSISGLKVIGITGSYGKTSTKHFLHTILSEKFETLMTPGSYNTTMGVVRTVREMMKPYTQIFICEMGAKQKGDIKEICDLVDPECGIITAVGPMHLETFGNLENVCNTKFELADAVPSSGFVAVNNDFAPSAAREVVNTRCLRYAVANTKDAQFYAKDVAYSKEGTSFTLVCPDGKEERYSTAVIGECNVSNIVGAITVAKQFGMTYDEIRIGVGRIRQVEHRLSVKHTAGGVTIIDDAFNSNPDGSKMALETLGQFAGSGKRICVSPGMIELGDRRDALNKVLGQHIGRNADIAIIVNEYNREALAEGVLSVGFPKENLHIAESFEEAQKILSTLLQPGDVVLYENDLPDTFK